METYLGHYANLFRLINRKKDEEQTLDSVELLRVVSQPEGSNIKRIRIIPAEFNKSGETLFEVSFRSGKEDDELMFSDSLLI